MNKRVRKSQVIKLMDEVSAMDGIPLQFHNLRKEYNPSRECYSWVVNYCNQRGDWNRRYVGDTLTECREYFEIEQDEAKYREHLMAQWQEEN